MTDIYLDRIQCLRFAVPYDGDGKLIVAADTLLKSKSGGYDLEHIVFLKDAEEDTLVMSRTDESAPGWYAVTKVIPSFKRPKAVRDAFRDSMKDK